MSVLWMDVKRAFGGNGLYLAIVGVFLIFLLGALGYITSEEGQDIILYFNITYSIGGLTTILTVFTAIPYASAFYDDLHSNSLRCILIRTKKEVYCWSKIVICVLTSGIAMVIGMSLFLVVLSFKLPWVLVESVNYESFAYHSAYGQFLVSENVFLYFAVYAYILFLVAGFLGLIGLFSSLLFDNKFVTMMAPLIFYYAVCVLGDSLGFYERAPYLQLNLIMKGENILGSASLNLIYTTLLFVILDIVLGYWCTHIIKERIKNGQYT